VPGWLQLTAGWAWRLLVVGVVIYLAFRLASALRIVVLPFIAALLLAALLQPLTRRLRRAGLPALSATWCTLLVAVAVLAGVGVLAATPAIAGIAGAIVAVPITAALVRAWPYLQGRAPAPPGAHADQPGEVTQRR
jgi:predicted PurR-regulated permease PerM